MKFTALLSLIGIYFTLALWVPCGATDHTHHHKGNVKYVQGGACAPGKGTKKCPFASLQEAEASNWDVLIVRSSPIALEGGITLKNGQQLIGEEDPTCLGLSPTQPTITNTSDALNNGHGVTVQGNATIQNIFFKNIFRSAIFSDDAECLTVQDVLIDGYDLEISNNPAIRGISSNEGKTDIERIIVRNGTGIGLSDGSRDGAQRKLSICSSEFFDIHSTGIITASDTGSQLDTKVSRCFFHDITGSNDTSIYQSTTNNDSTQNISIKHSTFSHNPGMAITISSTTSTGSIALEVDSCLIEEQELQTESAGIFVNTFPGTNTLRVQNTQCINKDAFVVVVSNGNPSTQTTKLLNNSAVGRVFFGAQNFAPEPGEQSTISTLLKNNLFTAIVSGAAIAIGTSEPWKRFTLCAENNCFDGNFFPQSVGFAVSNSSSLGIATEAPATISAHHNNIIGFDFDIADFSGGIQYQVAKNFWGPLTDSCPCVPPYQTCVMNGCLGPDNVALFGSPTSSVDATKPLIRPILCPHACCESRGIIPHPQPSLSTPPSVEQILALPKLSLAIPTLPKKRS
jgi:hypothetical protein